jgi:hypothetical protein
MTWRLGNSIRLRLQTVLQLWRTYVLTRTSRAWESINENIKTSAKESLGLQHKPWFDEEYLCILDQRKQAKMKWIQDPSQSNIDNLNNVRLTLRNMKLTVR